MSLMRAEWRGPPCSQGSQCVCSCLGPRNSPRGAGGAWFQPQSVGGAVRPSQAFQLAQCGGRALGGPWRLQRGHQPSYCLRCPQAITLCGPPPEAGNLCLRECSPCVPRECMPASGRQCLHLCLSFCPTEVMRTFPGKANTHVSWPDMPRS